MFNSYYNVVNNSIFSQALGQCYYKGAACMGALINEDCSVCVCADLILTNRTANKIPKKNNAL